MDIFGRIDSLPDNVRRQILEAVRGNSARAGASHPPRAAAETETRNHTLLADQPAAATAAGGRQPAASSPACPGALPEVRLVGGACVVDDFIPHDQVKEALECSRQALAEGQQQAAIGGALPLTSAGRQVDMESRGDTMRWLHPDHEAAAGRGALAALMARMEALRQQLARQGYPVGGHPTYQLACYPGGGARYVRHADASVSCPTRTLTAIVYLNEPDWDPGADGGCLALYNVPYSGPLRGRGVAAGEPATVVAPGGGRLVVFESHLFHEVLPAYRNRYAVTAWFHPVPPAAASGAESAAAAAAAAAKDGAPPQLPTPAPAPAAPPATPASVSAPLPRPGEVVATPEHASPAMGRVSNDAARSCDLGAVAAVAAGVANTATNGCGGTAAAAPAPAAATAAAATSRIFVSVASYRDPEGPWTLHSLFSRAHHPERVRVGVVWQIDPATEAAFAGVAGSRSHPEWLQRVRQVVLPYSDAEGPCKARALAQSLWSGEEYVLQIDSHMRMVSGWDTLCIRQLADAEAASPTGKAVLSTYPLGYSGSGAAASVPHEATAPATLLCAKGFGQDGFLRTAGRVLRERPAAPLPAYFWAAGLSFARSEWLQEVPYCPHLPHLFFGEESYMLARMWTRGWDVFAPAAPLAFHQWERTARERTYQRDLLGEAAVEEVEVEAEEVEAVRGGHCEARPEGQAGSSCSQGREGEGEGEGESRGRGRRGQELVPEPCGQQSQTATTAAAAAAGGSVGVLRESDEGAAAAAAEAGAAAAAVAAAAARKRSQARVLKVLSGRSGDAEGGGGGGGGWGLGEVWGLGTERSLAQLAAVGGVDYGARAVGCERRATWGGLREDAFEP